MSKQTEITIKEGHLSPSGSKEVIVENDRWEVSLHVADGFVRVVVNNTDDRDVSVRDVDNQQFVSFPHERSEVYLEFKAKGVK